MYTPVSVAPGPVTAIIAETVEKGLRMGGFRFGLTLAFALVSTVSGALAQNSGGEQCYAFDGTSENIAVIPGRWEVETETIVLEEAHCPGDTLSYVSERVVTSAAGVNIELLPVSASRQIVRVTPVPESVRWLSRRVVTARGPRCSRADYRPARTTVIDKRVQRSRERFYDRRTRRPVRLSRVACPGPATVAMAAPRIIYRSIETTAPLPTISLAPLPPDDPPPEAMVIRNEITACEDETEQAEFPWPPPPASARAVLPSPSLLTGAATLGDVAERIENALGGLGYHERSYYQVPGGFALVTRLEQIDEFGVPLTDERRWLAGIAPVRPPSLTGWLSSLFSAPEGRFRVIALILTSEVVGADGAAPSQADALGWVSAGDLNLTQCLADSPYTNAHILAALIYEFRQIGVNNPRFEFGTDVTEHMNGSGLGSALQ